MFNFMKKSAVLAGGDTGSFEERDGEKERRKKEKKERKEREKRERIAGGLEEPLRLEEVREEKWFPGMVFFVRSNLPTKVS